jgi:hypothetical protein
MDVQVDKQTGEIMAWGLFPAGSLDPNIDIVEVLPDEESKIHQLGMKHMGDDGVITVTPPPESPPLPPQPDYGSDALDVNSVNGEGRTQLIAAVRMLRDYLGTPVASVTPTQREATLRMVIKCQLAMMHVLFGERVVP